MDGMGYPIFRQSHTLMVYITDRQPQSNLASIRFINLNWGKNGEEQLPSPASISSVPAAFASTHPAAVAASSVPASPTADPLKLLGMLRLLQLPVALAPLGCLKPLGATLFGMKHKTVGGAGGGGEGGGGRGGC